MTDCWKTWGSEMFCDLLKVIFLVSGVGWAWTHPWNCLLCATLPDSTALGIAASLKTSVLPSVFLSLSPLLCLFLCYVLPTHFLQLLQCKQFLRFCLRHLQFCLLIPGLSCCHKAHEPSDLTSGPDLPPSPLTLTSTWPPRAGYWSLSCKFHLVSPGLGCKEMSVLYNRRSRGRAASLGLQVASPPALPLSELALCYGQQIGRWVALLIPHGGRTVVSLPWDCQSRPVSMFPCATLA